MLTINWLVLANHTAAEVYGYCPHLPDYIVLVNKFALQANPTAKPPLIALCDFLEQESQNQEFAALVMLATAPICNSLKQQLPPTVRQQISHELHHDYLSELQQQAHDLSSLKLQVKQLSLASA